MKKIVVSFLSILTFGMTGCLDDDCSNVRYYQGTAIVKHTEAKKPLLEVLNGVVLIAPGLSGTTLEEGDLLWTNFLIDEGLQTNPDSTIISSVRYERIDSSLVKPVSAAAAGYTYPIDAAMMWLNYVGKIYTFEFKQDAPAGQVFDYEMLYEKKDQETYPTVYIRSKKINDVESSKTWVTTRFGFDFTLLAEEYMDETTNRLTFNVKYLSGFDNDGKELFTSFRQNPISLTLPKEDNDTEPKSVQPASAETVK